MDVTPAIETDDLEKRYVREDGTPVRALRGVSLSVREGALVTVVGPSGCGKTTLVRLVAGLEPPTAGTVRVAGRPVTGPGPDKGVVFQESRLFPWLTVRENVAFGLEERSIPPDRRRSRVEELLSTVGLEGHGDAYPKSLSGGMKQRVGIARSLAVDPDVLLADEPFASVDAGTRRRLQSELLDLWRSTGKTILFVTHDVEEAVLLGDRVVALSADGTVRSRIDVDLSRPRDRTAGGVAEYRSRVLEAVDPDR